MHFILDFIKDAMATFLGDNNKKQVHDLLNIKDNCCVDIIKTVHKRYFIPDSSEQANSEGYDSCQWCISNYHR